MHNGNSSLVLLSQRRRATAFARSIDRPAPVPLEEMPSARQTHAEAWVGTASMAAVAITARYSLMSASLLRNAQLAFESRRTLYTGPDVLQYKCRSVWSPAFTAAPPRAVLPWQFFLGSLAFWKKARNSEPARSGFRWSSRAIGLAGTPEKRKHLRHLGTHPETRNAIAVPVGRRRPQGGQPCLLAMQLDFWQ